MNISYNQFGLIIAYLLPGFIVLAGLAPLNPLLAAWIVSGNQIQAGLGPPLYAVLTATTFGMIASCLRWCTVDQLHSHTGLRPPAWNDRSLGEHLAAFNYLVESHYRYYQFVANTLVAVGFVYVIDRLARTTSHLGPLTDLCVLVLSATLFAASRDALSKYYKRTAQLLGTAEAAAVESTSSRNSFTGGTMHYNGNHSDNSGNKSTTRQSPVPKVIPTAPTGTKPEQPPKEPPGK